MMFDSLYNVNCSIQAILHEENDSTDAFLYLLFLNNRRG